MSKEGPSHWLAVETRLARAQHEDNGTTRPSDVDRRSRHEPPGAHFRTSICRRRPRRSIFSRVWERPIRRLRVIRGLFLHSCYSSDSWFLFLVATPGRAKISAPSAFQILKAAAADWLRRSRPAWMIPILSFVLFVLLTIQIFVCRKDFWHTVRQRRTKRRERRGPGAAFGRNPEESNHESHESHE